ncbi:hypothetical protein WJX73_002289 [Symbiochloris irregularis]|uniref:diacylglycerol O-acyltransferase n=1 Tax=Symbiochloris irregularis TaxID=706552 RepID=A0AAW1P6Z1_9CHLO
MAGWRLRISVGCSWLPYLFIILQLASKPAAWTNLRVSARQSSFRLQASSKQEGADVWNAAAVYHPTLGWVATATHSSCFWAAPGCGIFEQTPRPWVAFLGKSPTPDLHRFDEYGRVWHFDNTSLAEPFQSIGHSNESLYAPLDYRPFIWNGSVFVGFSLRVAINFERMAIAELNPESTTLRLHQIFDRPLHGDFSSLGTEKNWAFFERNDSLLILYKIFPCTHIFEFQAELPRHAEEKLATCYKDRDHAVAPEEVWTGSLFWTPERAKSLDSARALGGQQVQLMASLGDGSGASSLQAQLAQERQRTVTLQQENERLLAVVTAKQHCAPSRMGYLYKHRPYATGLFSNSWELRFFTLAGSALQYYKSEQDAAQHPRGHVDLEGTILEWEGQKRTFHVFSIVARSGVSLVRMSTSSLPDAETWMEALVGAGCEKRSLNTTFRSRSPLRAADVRWDGTGSRSASRASSGSIPVESRRDLEHRYEDRPAQSQPDSANASAQTEADLSVSSKDPRHHPHQNDYTSDSGRSEAGALPRVRHPPRDVKKTHFSRQDKGSMTGATNLHLECRPSMLSAQRIALTQHSGILNLMMLVLICANARLIVENLLKYGVLANPAHWLVFFLPDGNLPLLLCWPLLALFALAAFLIECTGLLLVKAEKKASVAKRKKGDVRPADARRLAARMARSHETLLWFVNAANIGAQLAVPAWTVRYTRAEPVPSFFLMLFTTVLMMKLVSYAHCNCALRHEFRQQQHKALEADVNSVLSRQLSPTLAASTRAEVPYPQNLVLSNLAYFLVVPTLVYQTSYPRSSRMRGRWVLWYLARGVAICGLLLVIVEQYLVPTIANSLVPLRQLNWPHIAERVLKLSLPTLYGWVFLFYVLFHLWLNVLAEVTLFGDREFYKDWWNATTIGDYWRLWNMPVHKWMLRHVYYPSLRLGCPRVMAMLLVFTVSAAFHELLVAWPLHMVKGWAFWGVMAQVPLVFITEFLKQKAKSDQVGNFIFWISFCIIGQPMAFLLYYHDWVLLNRPQWIDRAHARTAAT